MNIIIGLGNPEEEYKDTRHNMGFDVINKISEEYNIEIKQKKFNGLYGSGNIAGKKVLLLKPQTYMNLSGESIREIVEFYKAELKDILVIYDDFDVEPGNIKIRKAGGAGGHNGMKSIVQCLNTTEFPRIRVGIGKPEHKSEMIDYVIKKIKKEERENLDKGIDKAKQAVVEFIKSGIDTAMNKFN